MSLVGLRKELEARGWECRVMNLNENRRVPSPKYINVQNGWDYLRKLVRCVREGCAVHVRVNGEAVKGYIVALLALLTARLWRRPPCSRTGKDISRRTSPLPVSALAIWRFHFFFVFRFGFIATAKR